MPDYAELIDAFREDTAAARRRRPAPRSRGILVPVGLAGLLAAVAALVVVGVGARPVEGPLASGQLTGDVRLEVEGSGTVSGSVRDVRLTWDAGTLGVEVEPHRGVRLAVQTAEATVEVVGTGFVVERDALGTEVTVRHGRVRVTCAGGEPAELGAGAGLTCAPATAAGRLGRVRALQARGAPYADEVLAALALPDAVGSVRDELNAAQLDGYLAGGDPRAFALAEELASGGGPRALSAHRIAARLAADCAAARPHLAALAAADALAEDAPAWESCRSAP